MEMTQETASNVTFQVAEEGEAIGTLQQFADRLHLSRPTVFSCLRANEATPVVLEASREENPLLIVDADGMDALIDCAAQTVL